MSKSRVSIILSLVLVAAGSCGAYTYRASDFATEVVSYDEGLGAAHFNDPSTSLGRPVVDTRLTNGNPAPAIPILPASQVTEVVQVGEEGCLQLKFDHRVLNEPGDHFGVDFVLFGNAMLNKSGLSYWTNGDPNLASVVGTWYSEPGVVSVSQDGVTWHSFADRYADDWAPTLGRVYDTVSPDPALGAANRWWGEPTDPTLPLDPAVTAISLAGKTVAAVAQRYGRSAGGTGFDIAQLGLDWIQYVQITNPAGSGSAPDIDAVSDASATFNPGDMTGEGLINGQDIYGFLLDLASTDKYWQRYPANDPLRGDLNGDNLVNGQDIYPFLVTLAAPTSTPEPASLALMGLAAAMTISSRRGKHNRS